MARNITIKFTRRSKGERAKSATVHGQTHAGVGSINVVPYTTLKYKQMQRALRAANDRRSASPIAKSPHKPKDGAIATLETVAAAIGQMFPDKLLRYEGDMYGYEEPTLNEITGQWEQVFVPLIHVNLIDALNWLACN